MVCLVRFEVTAMSETIRRKAPKTRSAAAGRDAKTGRFVGLIDEHDAREFRHANTAFKKTATASKASAIKALQASGYLDGSGRIAKRYR
jgi:hypothetical protein